MDVIGYREWASGESVRGQLPCYIDTGQINAASDYWYKDHSKHDTDYQVEEVIAASLRRMSQVYDEPQRFLVSAGKELATLLGTDFNRLKSVLSKIR